MPITQTKSVKEFQVPLSEVITALAVQIPAGEQSWRLSQGATELMLVLTVDEPVS